MHLRQETLREDAEIAMRAMLTSYIETQKHGAATKIKSHFKEYIWLDICYTLIKITIHYQ